MTLNALSKYLATSTILSGAMATLLAWPALAADVTAQRLVNADSEPQNWLLPMQDYAGDSFSALDGITRDNVKNLHVAFTVPLGSALSGRNAANLMNHPIVADGMMYLDDGNGGFYKLDVTSGDNGEVLWKADAGVSKDESQRTRGVAIYGHNIYQNLTDGRVVAIDTDTGEFAWDQQIARVAWNGVSDVNMAAENFTASPLPVDGKILVGQSNGDSLTRGWLEAVDAATGKPIWRTFTVPGPGEPGHETWKDTNDAWKVGGAALWITGTYDPDTKLTYWGTGNAEPMYDVEYRPGDNLYSDSILAINVDDGSIKWHFQYLPNGGWDYDESGVHQIIHLNTDGQDRTILDHWGRNGFHYRIDASTGTYMDSTQYVDKVNWTAGIDAKTGKPVEYDPNLALQTYIPETRFLRGKGVMQACPTTHGGLRWQPPSYNPTTHITYQASLDGCFDKEAKESFPIEGGGGLIDPKKGGGIRGAGPTKYVEPTGLVTAADVTTNKILARVHYPYEAQSSALDTAGGVLFTGFLDGRVVALDDQTLKELWHFNTGSAIKGAFISYGVDGKQYIAIIAGANPGSGLSSQHPELANMTNGATLYVFSL